MQQKIQVDFGDHKEERKMPFFDSMFTEPRNPIIYKGNLVYPGEFIDGPKKFKAKITVISTNSKYRQGISFYMFGMKGTITYRGETRKRNGFSFWADEIDDELTLDIDIKEGTLWFGNFCDNTGTGSRVSGFSGFAMMIEDIGENKKRYYCNDWEPDEDFDDLIFDVEFIE